MLWFKCQVALHLLSGLSAIALSLYCPPLLSLDRLAAIAVSLGIVCRCSLDGLPSLSLSGLSAIALLQYQHDSFDNGWKTIGEFVVGRRDRAPVLNIFKVC